MPTIDEIRATLRPGVQFEDVAPFEFPEERYQVSLYITDDQMRLLNSILAAEGKRLAQKKPVSPTGRKQLHGQQYDLQEIQASLAENVW